MMERKDWLMLGGSILAIIGLLIYSETNIFKPGVLGAGGESSISPLLIGGVVLGVIVLAAAGIFILVTLAKKTRAKLHQLEIDRQVATGPTVYLLPRSDTRPVIPGKVNLWGRLADALPHDEHLSFELVGNETEIGFSLHGSERGLRAALTQIRSEWPGVQQRPVESDPASVPEGWHTWWCECTPATWDKPVTSLSDDPLRAVLIEMKSVVGQGRGLLQVIARNDFGTRKQLGQAAFAARDESPASKGVKALRSQEAKELETRVKRTFLQATIRTVGFADTPERAQGIARGLARSVSASFSHSNLVRQSQEGTNAEPVTTRQMGQVGIWADDELVNLGHLVGQDMIFVAPRLKVASAKSLAAAPKMRTTSIDSVAVFADI
jgi:hypothetical protein